MARWWRSWGSLGWGNRASSTSASMRRRTQGWLVLESSVDVVRQGHALSARSSSCSRRYFQVEDRDDARRIREKVTGQAADARRRPQDDPTGLAGAAGRAAGGRARLAALDPRQRRQRTLDALKRVLLRESQVQPLLLVFEDLHWIDAETQALLDSLVESLPTARLLLLVNYRPEYQHGWGSKTYYTQLRLDPLPPASADGVPRRRCSGTTPVWRRSRSS